MQLETGSHGTQGQRPISPNRLHVDSHPSRCRFHFGGTRESARPWQKKRGLGKGQNDRPHFHWKTLFAQRPPTGFGTSPNLLSKLFRFGKRDPKGKQLRGPHCRKNPFMSGRPSEGTLGPGFLTLPHRSISIVGPVAFLGKPWPRIRRLSSHRTHSSMVDFGEAPQFAVGKLYKRVRVVQEGCSVETSQDPTKQRLASFRHGHASNSFLVYSNIFQLKTMNLKLP